MVVCTPLDPAEPIAERLANYLDCHAEALGQSGFAHLSGDWLGQAALSGALTIYIALIGYRLLLGHGFGPRAAVLSAVRVGAVLAFATSWPAYDAVAYRLVTDGPAELATQVLPTGLGPVSLLDAARRVDFDLATLQGAMPQNAGTEFSNVAARANAEVSSGAQASQNRVAPILDFPGAVLLTSTIGALAALRIAAGALLGFGPVFIIMALFDSTLGVFEGWVRGLLAVFLGSAGAVVVTTLELNFIESDLVASMSAGPGVNNTSSLLATAVMFSTVMLTVLVLAVAAGRSFRLPRRGPFAPIQTNAIATVRGRASQLRATPAGHEPISRAQGVADAVLRLSRREAALGASGGMGHRSPLPIVGSTSQDLRTTASPSGQASRRRSASSSLASSRRRDGL
jgi:type IV secretion system protein VirB6